jgi:TPR repeat protein
MVIVLFLCSHCFALFGDKRIGQAKRMWKEGRYRQAAQLLRKVCAESNEKACNSLFELMKKLPDGVRAELEAECNRGSADACADLGWHHWAKADFSIGCQYYHRACEYGDALSCWCIGLAYSGGKMLRMNCTKAEMFLLRACDKNIGLACLALGSMYEHGCGSVSKNRKLARKYLKKACSLHVKEACKELRPLWRKVLGF